MEKEIQRVVRIVSAGLIFQAILAIGLNLYVFGRNGIELNSISIAIGTLVYSLIALPKNYRVIGVGRKILKSPVNFTEEQKNEYLEIVKLNVRNRVVGGSKKEFKVLTVILLLMSIWFGFLYLKYI